jgi:hypothetical protein
LCALRQEGFVVAETDYAPLTSIWCTVSGDAFEENGTNNDTIMALISIARDGLQTLRAGLEAARR